LGISVGSVVAVSSMISAAGSEPQAVRRLNRRTRTDTHKKRFISCILQSPFIQDNAKWKKINLHFINVLVYKEGQQVK